MGEVAVEKHLRVQTIYPIHQLEDVQITWQPNEHGRLLVRGIVDEAVNVSATLQALASDEIRVYESDGQQETTLFRGWISAVQTTHTQGVYHIELEGLSGSAMLDGKRHRRTFQNTSMSYAEVMDELVSAYPGHDVLYRVGEGVPIGEPVIQYDETDWELLKRLASHFQSVVVCDILEARPKLFVGIPPGKSLSLSADTSYLAGKDLLAFQRAGGYEAGLHDTDFFYYDIQSTTRMSLGDEVAFRGKSLIVSEVKGRMKQGDFVCTYRLSRAEGIRRERVNNAKLTGISLSGEVLEVKGEQVKLHLSVDSKQAKEGAHWYPFSPATGSAMYCMPKVGTQASLYVPDASGAGALVVGSVRSNGASCAKMGDPSQRYFGTEHGSELALLPSAIHLTGGSKEPLKLSFDDETGITMTSHKKLTLNAKMDISLYTPKRVVIRAQSQLMAKKLAAQSGFTIEGDYHFLGTNVKAAGTDRTSFAPYDDEPKRGVKPEPPPEPPKKKKKFSWGKLAGNVLGALAVVAVVAVVAAVTVATLGAGAVVIGAVVAGVMAAGAVAVGSKAASDIRRGEVSDFSDYAPADAFRELMSGAASGALFGPVKKAWEAYKDFDPMSAGILAGIGTIVEESVLGLADMAWKGLDYAVNNPLGALEFVTNPIAFTAKYYANKEHRDELLRTLAGVWEGVKQDFKEDVIHGDTYSRSKYGTELVLTIASFFVGGEAGAASRATRISARSNQSIRVLSAEGTTLGKSYAKLTQGMNKILDVKFINPFEGLQLAGMPGRVPVTTTLREILQGSGEKISNYLKSEGDSVGSGKGGGSSGFKGTGDVDHPIRTYRNADLSKLEAKYTADPRLTVEMPYVGKGKNGTNSEGWLRDKDYYWKEVMEKYPESISKANKQKIELGFSPINDKQFREHFPQFNIKELNNDTLIHHHIGGGGQAVAVPSKLHPGSGGIHNAEKEAGIWGSDSQYAELLEKFLNK
ncbi:contractile injection system protein, VgrG/Pvc8 family [Paenibacillus alba]|uniref:Contractile injection system protein, VgrG/Pvc8 family n=1 Tax=Paenibacillus alba TaxID=1197127 RepID=A0ABU6G0A0_9BACL|nr:contractile injection system protein, VgrG/Pvc8 family [Paenibacillus alba]MEC0226303.1 contractile injection system protein, VgrG/Pvc8 family [Paenibacillus alba]